MDPLNEQTVFLQNLALLIQHAEQRGDRILPRGLSCDGSHCAIELALHEPIASDAFAALADYWARLHANNSSAAADGARTVRFVRDWSVIAQPARERTSIPSAASSPAVLPFMGALRAGTADERGVVLLQSGLRELGYAVGIDGKFGPGTTEAVKRFQADQGLLVDGVVGEKTWTTLVARVPRLFQEIARKWLGDEDFAAAAQKLQIDEAALRAVYQVESGRCGFIGLLPKILFEGHIFWRQLRDAGIDPRAHVRGNEDILYAKWTTRHYRGGMGEHQRLARAKQIHEAAALRSASWGLFQIMGFHAEHLGYGDVHEFVARMSDHEREQLDAFCRFVVVTRSKGKSLVEHLRNRDWAAFAFGYNGSGYRENRYDEKLAAAFGAHHTGERPGSVLA